MAFRRLVIAAAILLTAAVWKLTLPSFAQELLPAVKTVLSEEQLVIVVPDGMARWAGIG